MESLLPKREDAHIAAAHERWYAEQPMVACKRCGWPMPNHHDVGEYCSRSCELGYRNWELETNV